MDKTILKKFAIESRNDLMEKMENKIKSFFIDEEFNKQQNGELYVLSNDRHTLNLTKEEYDKRELLIRRIKELGLEQVIEESAYTWFNRIIAIRYMEVNDYLPLTSDNSSLGIRVLSSEDNTPDPEIMKFTNLINTELDIGFKKEEYISYNSDDKKFKYILLLVCKKLGQVIPQVFNGLTDYIDLLIPDNLLNDTGFITKVVNEIPIENFKQVEIIGWLYQYYNQTEKDRVMSENKAYKKNEIPYATQLFTPDWIVKYMVENSLGRYFVEEFNDKKIVSNWKYYIDTKDDNAKYRNKKIQDIKFIDPCCGSGHILVYAFEIFYQAYLYLGFNKKDICELILKNNLYGTDIDERAAQLSVLSVLLKAREFDKDIFNKKVTTELNIIDIKESDNIDLYAVSELCENDKKLVYELIEDLKNAKEYGSLLNVKENDYSDIIKKITLENNIFTLDLFNKLIPMIKTADILKQKYDVIVTNPPYLNQGAMSDKMKKFLSQNYKNSKSDLCVAFMESNLLDKDGYFGIINQHSWMFLNSFEKFRENFVYNYNIKNMIHLGTRAFEEISGEVVQTTTFIFNKDSNKDDSIFIRLVDIDNAVEKEKKFLEIIKDENKYIKANIKDFIQIPGIPLAYWISKNSVNAFKENKLLGEFIDARIGMVSGNNNRFLRFWYEVCNNKIEYNAEKNKNNKKWIPLQKGGGYRKWYGNLEYVINWENEGYEIQNDNFLNGRLRAHNFNGEQIFKSGITWNSIATDKFVCRYAEKGFIFDAAGPLCEIKEKKYEKYILGFLSSIVCNEFFKLINPTINFTPGYLSNLPIKFERIEDVENIVDENINISKVDWNNYETSWNFTKHPFIKYKNNNSKIEDIYDIWKQKSDDRFRKLKNNEEKLNSIFIDMYNLKDQISMEISEKDVSLRKSNLALDIKSFISYTVGCMFGRYSLDKEGLIYAGGDLNENNYTSFKIDEDNIIPITDEAYFGDDIVSRFKNFIEVVYGKETLIENIDYIAETLGKKGTETSEETIRRYFLNDFYSDHIKMYQKKPIYWLFDSGKKNGFKALIYMHRYNENTVPKVRLDYLHRIQTTYEKLLTDINYKLTTDLSMTDKKETQKRQVDLNNKLTEIKEYDEKIAHIANQRINIDLDDGVTVNYAKFADILAKIK